MTTFGEILAHFKTMARGEPENIVPLMQDDGLISGLIAWKSVVIAYTEAGECPHQDDNRKWQWLWDNIQFDSTVFATVAGVRMQDVSALLTRLKGLRLIYPDGTINELAKDYLQSIIANKIRSSMRGIPKPRPEPKPVGSSEKF